MRNGVIERNEKGQFKKTHGKTNTRLYNIWGGMKDRCYAPYCSGYERYGAKGITICKEWLDDFMCFYNWAINNGYNDHLTIDRIDNDKGYSPDNCRWATSLEQQNNIRRNNNIEINGEIKSISEWSRISGVSRQTIQRRHDKGFRNEDLIQPVKDRSAEFSSGVKFIKWDKSKNSWRTEAKVNGIVYWIGYIKDLQVAKQRQEDFINELNKVMIQNE